MNPLGGGTGKFQLNHCSFEKKYRGYSKIEVPENSIGKAIF